MDEDLIRKQVVRAEALGLEAYRCPTTGNILEGFRGDDKVMCYCKSSRGGTHYKSQLVRVTTREYVIDYLSRE